MMGPWNSSTVDEMLAAASSAYSDGPAVKPAGSDTVLSYRDLDESVRTMVRKLMEAGLARGDVVLVIGGNTVDRLVLELAAACRGAVIVPLHPSTPVERVLGTAEKVSAVMAYIDGRATPALEMMRERGWRELGIGGMLGHPDLRGWAFEASAVPVQGDDLLYIMYTSGTSGCPKGVMLTHRNVLFQTGATRGIWMVGSGDRFLTHLPWHHSFGGALERFLSLSHGACMAVVEDGASDMVRFVELWKMERPTIVFSVPSVHRSVAISARLNRAEEEIIFHTGLRFIHTAAAPIPREAVDIFLDHGVEVYEGWGLTETAPCCTIRRMERGQRAGIVGKTIPGVDLRISDGEILVRGPNVMRGYFGDVEGTAAALDGNGWFRTGDLGEIVDGELHLIGRKDGLVKLSNGEFVPASRLEGMLVSSDKNVAHALVVAGPASEGGSGGEFLAALLWPPPGSDTGDGAWAVDIVTSVNSDADKGFKRIAVVAIMAPVGSGSTLVTTSGKLMRMKAMEEHCGLIDGIYRDIRIGGRGEGVELYRSG